MKFYVASRASIPERSAMWRRLRASGVNIISTWIDEAGSGQTADLNDLWFRIGHEIANCNVLVLYAEADDFPLKGALVEVGMALGMGKSVWVVTPNLKVDPITCKPLGSWIKHSNVMHYVITPIEELLSDFKKS